MSIPSPSLLKRPITSQLRTAADRRRHKRFPLTLLGRFMRATKHEYPCKLIDISVGGAAMMSPVGVEEGERIVAYFDHIGGIEGHVSRIFDGGFAIHLQATQHKREKLAAQITWLINREHLSGIDARRHERFTVGQKISTLKLAEGLTTECRILDVSLSGASVETDARPQLGTELMLGKLRSLVVRHHEHGIGVQFLDIQEPEALRRYFG